jgi:glutamyl-Q tRNA(Asp) synthetase
MARITRFAPSPTGPLHLGHAYAALIAASRGDRFLIRIEDIDRTRCKPEYEAQIYDDLTWLGLTWETPVLKQSTRQLAYDAALAQLGVEGLTYHCTCTRSAILADIRAALAAPQEGVADPVYPGTCREAGHTQGAIRLNMTKAAERLPDLTFLETGTRPGVYKFNPGQLIASTGDIILSRKDIGVAYHLAVVVDDAHQAITEVTRGEDLFAATPIHVALQRLLNLATPQYHHHKLIRDTQGKRLAKRDDARALSKYRAEGFSSADIHAKIGL